MKYSIDQNLAQKYAQVILGFITEAILRFEEAKANKEAAGFSSRKQIILPNEFQSAAKKIEHAYGDLQIKDGILNEYDFPVISARGFYASCQNYFKKFGITFRAEIFATVFNDMIKLRIMDKRGVEQKDKKDPILGINKDFFSKKNIERNCFSLREALGARLQNVVANEKAKEILLILCLTSVFSDEEIASISPEKRQGILFQKIGRGMLLARLRSKGILYDSFMTTVDALVSANILIEGCYQGQECITINPILKPFSTISAIIRNLEKKLEQEKAYLFEMEVASENWSPLAGVMDLHDLNSTEHNIYLFQEIEFGPHGL